jgi:Glycosyl hydrolase catalytic core
MLKGCALNWVLSNDGTQILFGQKDIDALSAAGATVVRFDLRLGSRTSWDATIIANYTTVINQMLHAGLTPIVLLGPGIVYGATQTQWNANNVENGGSGWNNFLQQYVNTVRKLASTYTQVPLWEIWNEPNAWTSHPSATVYTGGSFIYPSLYANVLSRVYAYFPVNVPVISGGLLGHDLAGLNADSAGATYLAQVYGYLRGVQAFDAIGWHCYLDQGKVLDPEHVQQYLNDLFKVMVENDDARSPLPLYVTEFGWQQPGTTTDVQAENVATLLRVLRNNGYVAVACNFEDRDNPAASQYYGLYTNDWTPKPARDAFLAGGTP